MSTSRDALQPSALRHPAPIADGFALPWPTVVSGPTDGRKTCRISGAAPRLNTILFRLAAHSPAQAIVRFFKSP